MRNFWHLFVIFLMAEAASAQAKGQQQKPQQTRLSRPPSVDIIAPRYVAIGAVFTITCHTGFTVNELNFKKILGPSSTSSYWLILDSKTKKYSFADFAKKIFARIQPTALDATKHYATIKLFSTPASTEHGGSYKCRAMVRGDYGGSPRYYYSAHRLIEVGQPPQDLRMTFLVDGVDTKPGVAFLTVPIGSNLTVTCWARALLTDGSPTMYITMPGHPSKSTYFREFGVINIASSLKIERDDSLKTITCAAKNNYGERRIRQTMNTKFKGRSLNFPDSRSSTSSTNILVVIIIVIIIILAVTIIIVVCCLRKSKALCFKPPIETAGEAKPARPNAYFNQISTLEEIPKPKFVQNSADVPDVPLRDDLPQKPKPETIQNGDGYLDLGYHSADIPAVPPRDDLSTQPKPEPKLGQNGDAQRKKNKDTYYEENSDDEEYYYDEA